MRKALCLVSEWDKELDRAGVETKGKGRTYWNGDDIVLVPGYEMWSFVRRGRGRKTLLVLVELEA